MRSGVQRSAAYHGDSPWLACIRQCRASADAPNSGPTGRSPPESPASTTSSGHRDGASPAGRDGRRRAGQARADRTACHRASVRVDRRGQPAGRPGEAPDAGWPESLKPSHRSSVCSPDWARPTSGSTWPTSGKARPGRRSPWMFHRARPAEACQCPYRRLDRAAERWRPATLGYPADHLHEGLTRPARVSRAVAECRLGFG